MLQTIRTAWKANRHWVAAGFLGATALFLLLIFMNWRNEQRGIASSRATGLAAVNSWSVQSMWRSSPLLPWRQRERVRSVGVDYLTPSPKLVAGSSMRGVIGGVIGGVGGNPPPPAVPNSNLSASSDIPERQVIRTGSIEIIVSDPLQRAPNDLGRDRLQHVENAESSLAGGL